jgi:hypothetical protein
MAVATFPTQEFVPSENKGGDLSEDYAVSCMEYWSTNIAWPGTDNSKTSEQKYNFSEYAIGDVIEDNSLLTVLFIGPRAVYVLLQWAN